jgi:hypothetical protein
MSAATNQSNASKWDEMMEEAARDRRKEKRVGLNYPIEVFGFDRHGAYFAERTITQNVSPSGCRFEMKPEPDAQGVLAIRVVSREAGQTTAHKPMLFMVCWAQRAGRRWLVGASKLQTEDIWGLAAPRESGAS